VKVRYRTPAELEKAVHAWAAEVAPLAPRQVEGLRQFARSLEVTPPEVEKQAKQIHGDLAKALADAAAFTKKHPNASGHAKALRLLMDVAGELPRSLLLKPGPVLESLTGRGHGWTDLKHFVAEVGRPVRDPRADEGYRFESEWRSNADMDFIAALAVHAGLFTRERAEHAIEQAKGREARNTQGKRYSGATVKDGVDVLRKALRKHAKALSGLHTRARAGTALKV
jgi:hypothetical protein